MMFIILLLNVDYLNPCFMIGSVIKIVYFP